jgi:peptidoglycan/LPS O-acetylase OafA/YrhL
VLESGWIGVDLFFVLSGFLITGILVDSKTADHYFRNFYARRALRIFPLYYGVLALFLVGVPLLIRWHVPGLGFIANNPKHLSDLQSVQTDQLWYWFYGANYAAIAHKNIAFFTHFWSLSVEEHFYFVWPLVVFLFDRKWLLRICAGVALFSLALRTALVLTGDSPSIYLATQCRMDSLAIGAWVALAVRRWGLPRLLRPARAMALLTGAVLMVRLFTAKGFRIDDPVMRSGGFTFLALFFASLIVLSLGASATSAINRAMRWAPLRSLGKYSYGMYIFHLFALWPVARIFDPEKIAARLGSVYWAIPVSAAGGIAFVYGIAWVSWHLYEKHFLKLKKYFDDVAPDASSRREGLVVPATSE